MDLWYVGLQCDLSKPSDESKKKIGTRVLNNKHILNLWAKSIEISMMVSKRGFTVPKSSASKLEEYKNPQQLTQKGSNCSYGSSASDFASIYRHWSAKDDMSTAVRNFHMFRLLEKNLKTTYKGKKGIRYRYPWGIRMILIICHLGKLVYMLEP